MEDFTLQQIRSPEDIARALAISLNQCPRRYCWWWRSLAFKWDIDVYQGCTFVSDRDRGKVDPKWPMQAWPCRRADPASPADHYEPRDSALIEDGIETQRWVAR
jgi:hypothetical protein